MVIRSTGCTPRTVLLLYAQSNGTVTSDSVVTGATIVIIVINEMTHLYDPLCGKLTDNAVNRYSIDYMIAGTCTIRTDFGVRG
jgi:DeoR/GlpR family transcriptional regulator of sugar metabolism